MKKTLKLLIGASLVVALNAVNAGVVAPLTKITNPGTCASNLDNVTITNVETVVGGVQVNGSYPISATSCLGYISNPGNTFNDNNGATEANIGEIGDGLLNGESDIDTAPGGVKTDWYVDPLTFLDAGELFDADGDGDGVSDDPGWIRLGGQGDYDGNFVHANYDSVNGYNLDNVLDIIFTDNAWSLRVDPLAIPATTAVLGRPTTFDHLAFVFKAGNEWAIYDFDFLTLLNDGTLDIRFDTPYLFEGTWDTTGFGNNNAGMSHFSIWAHDPPAVSSVPLPGAVWLFGSALFGFAGFSRFKKKS